MSWLYLILLRIRDRGLLLPLLRARGGLNEIDWLLASAIYHKHNETNVNKKLITVSNLRVRSMVIMAANPATMARNWTILGLMAFARSRCMISKQTT